MPGGSLLVVSCMIVASSLPLSGQSSQPDSPRESTAQGAWQRPLLPSAAERSHIPISLPHPFPGPAGTDSFRQLAQAAGIIFSGKVTSVTRTPTSAGQPATLAISFHVEHAIRGVSPGRDFTIFLWIGVWNGGQRYQIGERVLLFLYSPSKLGLTSCVGGPLGRFSVDGRDRVVFSALHRSAFRTDPILRGKSNPSVNDLERAVRGPGGEE